MILKKPVIPAFEAIKSHELFADFCKNPKNVLTMPVANGRTLENTKMLQSDALNYREFTNTCKLLKKLGIKLIDLKDENIFVDNRNMYIGDMGHFEIEKRIKGRQSSL